MRGASMAISSSARYGSRDSAPPSEASGRRGRDTVLPFLRLSIETGIVIARPWAIRIEQGLPICRQQVEGPAILRQKTVFVLRRIRHHTNRAGRPAHIQQFLSRPFRGVRHSLAIRDGMSVMTAFRAIIDARGIVRAAFSDGLARERRRIRHL